MAAEGRGREAGSQGKEFAVLQADAARGSSGMGKEEKAQKVEWASAIRGKRQAPRD